MTNDILRPGGPPAKSVGHTEGKFTELLESMRMQCEQSEQGDEKRDGRRLQTFEDQHALQVYPARLTQQREGLQRAAIFHRGGDVVGLTVRVILHPVIGPLIQKLAMPERRCRQGITL